MVIQNTETTLAAALGVSGTLSPRVGLHPITPLTMIWRRTLPPADALLSPVGVQAGSALAERTINLNEGQWVTEDADGNLIVAADGTAIPAWPVWSGGDRLDPKGGVTVIHGAWIADTSYFVDTGTYAAGTPLIIATGSVQGTAGQSGALEDTTVTADATTLAPVVAKVLRPPFGTSAETPNGVMRIRAVL